MQDVANQPKPEEKGQDGVEVERIHQRCPQWWGGLCPCPLLRAGCAGMRGGMRRVWGLRARMPLRQGMVQHGAGMADTMTSRASMSRVPDMPQMKVPMPKAQH